MISGGIIIEVEELSAAAVVCSETDRESGGNPQQKEGICNEKPRGYDQRFVGGQNH